MDLIKCVYFFGVLLLFLWLQLLFLLCRTSSSWIVKMCVLCLLVELYTPFFMHPLKVAPKLLNKCYFILHRVCERERALYASYMCEPHFVHNVYSISQKNGHVGVVFMFILMERKHTARVLFIHIISYFVTSIEIDFGYPLDLFYPQTCQFRHEQTH